jgi:hypothetical protein
VWNDTNGNGIQEASEPSVPGVLISLLSCLKVPLGSATTSSTGEYRFSALPAGCYIVRVELPSGYVFSPQYQGGDNAFDSDVNVNTGETAPINLSVGQIDLTQDAGILSNTLPPKSAIGDFVWSDTDGDGIQENGELGVPNVPVALLDCSGNTIATRSTDSNGFYQFASLAAGCYVVGFSLPGGYSFSPQGQGGNGTLDSDPNPSTGRTSQINLAQAENNPNVDAGLMPSLPPKSAIGDYVWNDTNNNGVQDGGELGVPNVPVKLLDCAGNELTDDITDASGFYQFAPLAAGCYVVDFDPPASCSISPQGQGNDRTRDSDANPSDGKTNSINLAQAENNPNIDMGLTCGQPPTPTPSPLRGSLGDRVINDLDRDGVQDGIEPGMPGVVVMLQDCNGNTLSQQTTDPGGFYLFTNLSAGCYVVMFNAPSGMVFSPQDQGGNDADDSDANPSTGKTAQVNLDPGENNLTVDAGVYTPVTPPTPTPTPQPLRGSLGDRVWNDLDADGIQDGNEPGIDGIDVELFNCLGTRLATSVTTGGGFYLFTDLPAGCYIVRFVDIPDTFAPSPADQGGNDAIDSDSTSFFSVTPGIFTGETDPIDLSAGENDRTVDQGLYRPASLGDKVFRDDDSDGVQDANEPGVPGVVVMLQDCNGNTLRTDTTDANGIYGFSGLAPGCYVVMFNAPSGTNFSPQDQGGNDATDSDANPSTGKTAPINLTAGQNNLTVDAGITPQATCGVSVNKTCRVAQPPPTSNYVCTKPITEISMIWNGTAPVNVSTDAGQTFTNVRPGDSITARTNGNNDQIWTLSGGATGQSTFHVSCSDADMNGPEDCLKAAGDGKGKTGFVNTWIFNGMAGGGQRLTCTAPVTEFTDSCTASVTSSEPICTDKTKPTSLVFRYTGGGCSASNNPQNGKATCSGSVNGSQAVTIRAGKNGKNGTIDTPYVVTPSTVQPGQTFEVTGPFAADSRFIVSNAGGTQSLTIHTSCSQPLNVGNIFGSLTLVGKNGATGSASVTYQYEVRNTGDALTNVTVVDDKLGSITSAFSLLPGAVRSFTKSANLTSTTTNRVDVQGTLSNSQTCSANDSVTVTVR